jgi:hypothetical protein
LIEVGVFCHGRIKENGGAKSRRWGKMRVEDGCNGYNCVTDKNVVFGYYRYHL